MTAGGNLLTDNQNVNGIEQTNYSISTRYARNWSMGETKVRLGFASFDDDQWEFEDEIDFEDAVIEGEMAFLDIQDQELSFEVQHEIEIAQDTEIEFGVFFRDKDRDTNISEGEYEVEDLLNLENYDQFFNQPHNYGFEYEDFEAPDGGISTIEEQRVDFFALIEGENGPFKWEAGVRYETTDVSVNDMTLDESYSNDYDFWLPSAHIRWDVTEADRITASVARTVRRPNFDFISPAYLDGEYGDNDFFGNTNLQPETAYGFDLGYEHRIGRTGVFGVNIFYRDVSDLIEVQNTGAYAEEFCDDFEDDIGLTCDAVTSGDAAAVAAFDQYLDDEADNIAYVYTAENTGDGEVYGIEFDLSTPLDFIGMDNTGVFANLSLLDSSVTDHIGDRQFNNQSDYVYNVGFIQDLPDMNMAFGATYRQQGDAIERLLAEEVTVSYGADLEIFVERSWGDNFTLRFVGSNLLDSSKDEVFNKFDTNADQINRDFDEYELETEYAGPVFQLMGRWAF
ncbi:TonB-dependent receptor plug domain-containing protein [Ponticaulis sp.]|uniref:TonB-dependent receptor plug domain-containing protein n=1 Tax=Ponticaulis sp. TaxID=2020902 RepID=UPI00345D0479